MIKRNMKKIAPDAFASSDDQAMLEAFCKYVRMNPPVLSADKSDYVCVLFTGNDAELNVYQEDGKTEACGTQGGSEGKFIVFDSKHPYEVTGSDYRVIHFKEQG